MTNFVEFFVCEIPNFSRISSKFKIFAEIRFSKVVPIIALVIIDIVGQTILITHNCLTRDDVRWRTKSPMNCEIIQMDPNKKVWYRKALNINEKVSQPEGPIKAWEDSDYIEKNKTFISSPFNEKLFKEPEPEPQPEPEEPEPEKGKKGGKTAKEVPKDKEGVNKPKEVAEQQDRTRPKGLITKKEKKPSTTPKEVSAKSSKTEKVSAKETTAKKAAP